MKALRTVGIKLGAGIASVCAILIAFGGIAAWKQKSSQDELQRSQAVQIAKIEKTERLIRRLNEVAVSVRNMALFQTQQELQAERKRLDNAVQAYETGESELVDMMKQDGAVSDEAERLIQAMSANKGLALPLIKEAAQLGMDGATPDAVLLITTRLLPLQLKWADSIEQVARFENQRRAEAAANAQVLHRKTMFASMAAALLAIAVATMVAIKLTRSITHQINAALHAAERVAQGDLTTSVSSTSQDEIGRLVASIGVMQERLGEMVGGIRNAASQIALASREIAAGNLDLSNRTEDTAARLQRTVAFIEDITSSARQTNEAAKEADGLAKSASQVAADGGAAVAQVVETMQAITSSSAKISDIVGVVDGLAFQTNILALNAAIEAARAGPQGRGFAVVANEVRSLAHRSAESARAIKVLIEASTGQVDVGTGLVRGAGDTMNEIVSSTARVTAMLSDVADASNEQTAKIVEINHAVADLERTTQQNASLVEQSAAAAASLEEQAASLEQLVQTFRIR